jgi:hypothetical protein
LNGCRTAWLRCEEGFVADSLLEGDGFEPSRSPVCGELGAPGPRATRPRAIVKPRNADRSRRQARRAILRMPGAPFTRTKPPSSWRSASATPSIWRRPCSAFSATFEICRDDTICRQGCCRNSGRQRDSLIGAKITLIARFNSL